MLRPVQIVIGRGRGHQDRGPLQADAWGRFQAAIIAHLADPHEGQFYRLIAGLGVDADGRPEENATILGSVYEDQLTRLRNELDGLRLEFEQSVILLIVGELEIIA